MALIISGVNDFCLVLLARDLVTDAVVASSSSSFAVSQKLLTRYSFIDALRHAPEIPETLMFSGKSKIWRLTGMLGSHAQSRDTESSSEPPKGQLSAQL